MHIANIIRSLSVRVAESASKKRFLELFKKLLLRRTRTASDDTLDEVEFVHQMHQKNKNPEAVAVMIAQKVLKGEAMNHGDFLEEMTRTVYKEVIKQMYEYFESPEVSSDPMDWREVYNNIFESVADEKAGLIAQQVADRKGLNEMPEELFWAAVSEDIEDLIQ